MKPLQELLVFEISGYMAHFRKFYSNSSSLTYSFPPRTVVTGMLAGILGRERDTYYEEFSTQRCKVGVSIAAPIRKINQTVNFIRTKSKNELNGSAGPTQIPLEILLGEEDKVKFRVYFTHDDKSLNEELADRIAKNKYIYPPYMGVTEFMAQLELIDFLGKDDIEKQNSPGKAYIDTVINIDLLEDRGIAPGGENLKILREKMTVEFSAGRKIAGISSYVFEQSGKRFPVRLKIPYFSLKIEDEVENIVFMKEQNI